MSLFVVLMGAAWLFGSPPGSSPDEEAHYVKALGAGRGEFRGASPAIGLAQARLLLQRLSPGERAAFEASFSGEGAKQFDWQRRTSRKFSVPAGLGFSGFVCTFFNPRGSASCLDRGTRSTRDAAVATYVGTYQPFAYVLPGLLMRSARDPQNAMRRGRAGMAFVALGLLVLAVFLLWEGSRGVTSLIGLFASLTPAVLYFSSALNPSGPEIASAICFSAALLRVTRTAGQPAWVWASVGISGVVLAAGRSLGPAFVAAIAIGVALVVGPAQVARLMRRSPAPAVTTAGAIIGAAIAGLTWEVTVQPHPATSPSALGAEIGRSFLQLDDVGRQAVGILGWLDTPLPWTVYVAWGMLTLVVLVVAFAVAGRVTAMALGLLTTGVVIGGIAVSVIFRRTGFAMQGRYVLPLLVLLPLAAGEVLHRRGAQIDRSLRRALVVGAASVAALANGVAWWVAARRFAVGVDGPWFFFADAEWSPPGGWVLWTTTSLAAATLLLLGGVVAAGAVTLEPADPADV